MLHFSLCQPNRSLDSQVALKKCTQVKNKQTTTGSSASNEEGKNGFRGPVASATVFIVSSIQHTGKKHAVLQQPALSH